MSPSHRPPARILPPELSDSSGFGFSPVVIARPGGSLIFVSGQLADDQQADFTHQLDEAFDNPRLALAAAGATPQSVLRICCLVVDSDPDRRAVVSRARQHVSRGGLPVSTIIPVPRLAGPTALFEIDAIALINTPGPGTAQS